MDSSIPDWIKIQMTKQTRQQVINSMCIKDILEKNAKQRSPFERERLNDYVSGVLRSFLNPTIETEELFSELV